MAVVVDLDSHPASVARAPLRYSPNVMLLQLPTRLLDMLLGHATMREPEALLAV